MNETQARQADRLQQLHGEIIGAVHSLLDKVIEAGGILHEVKTALSHGEFTAWVEQNAGFNIRTAQRYMKIYENREQLKNDSVSLLTDAHNMLTAPKKYISNWAEWNERFAASHIEATALKAEWESVKDSTDLNEVLAFYRKSKAAAVEASCLLIDAEVNLGKVLNEIKRLLPTRGEVESSVQETLTYSRLTDSLITAGVTAEDIIQAGGQAYHANFYEWYQGQGMNCKEIEKVLRLVQ